MITTCVSNFQTSKYGVLDLRKIELVLHETGLRSRSARFYPDLVYIHGSHGNEHVGPEFMHPVNFESE